MNDSRRVIVIGSGPTGAIAAQQLSKKGIPVTLLESGSSFAGGLLVRALGKTVLRRQPPLPKGDGHVVSGDPRTSWYSFLSPGGLSNQWTGAVPRFSPEDFVEGERLHEKYRWPVQYTDLVPYYEIVERVLRVAGEPRDIPHVPASQLTYPRRLPADWQTVARFAEKQGHGLISMPIVDGGPWMLARRGTAFNSFTEIVRGLQSYPNFQLMMGAHVLQLIWSGQQKRVTGVLYQDRATGSQHCLEAAGVVLAAGPLFSTKILLSSACADFPQGLGNSHGVLGRYLHDHPKEWWVVDFDKPLSRLGHAAYLSRAPYLNSEPLLAAQYAFGSSSTREKIRGFLPGKTTEFGVLVFGTMRPAEANHVRLHPDAKDNHGQPQLDICIRYDASEIRNMERARERFLEILAAAGYKGTVREVVPQLEPGVSVHYGGTVRMHQSPKYGMLDGWNRLHEVPNVVVADSSCFTTAVEKNPTLTAMALAARAADRLADNLKTGNITS